MGRRAAHLAAPRPRSQHLIDATIATEDATFYSNPGIDPACIAGVASQNAQQGGVVSGASTITMQLARNLFLGSDDATARTWIARCWRPVWPRS